MHEWSVLWSSVRDGGIGGLLASEVERCAAIFREESAAAVCQVPRRLSHPVQHEVKDTATAKLQMHSSGLVKGRNYDGRAPWEGVGSHEWMMLFSNDNSTVHRQAEKFSMNSMKSMSVTSCLRCVNPFRCRRSDEEWSTWRSKTPRFHL